MTRVALLVGVSVASGLSLPGGVAATASGQVWAWGFNKYEQLCMAAPPFNYRQVTPISRPTPTGVTSVAAGLRHSVFLTSGGVVYQCGAEPGGLATHDIPSQVSFGAATTIVAIAAGDHFGLALVSDGTVRAWGRNAVGQLGNGTTTDSTSPVTVAGLTGVTAIAAGREHALALKSDKTVWAWGLNSNGQLGAGSSATFASAPVQVKTAAATNLANVTVIGAGGYHSLAVTGTGTLKSWGLNSDGQLGNSTTISSSFATDVSGPPLGAIAQVVGGDAHSLARRSDGSLVWAWGSGNSGQLGNGTFARRATPTPVLGLTGVIDIAAGPSAAHSMAIGARGMVWTWGWNFYNQLGNGMGVGVDNNQRISLDSPLPTLSLGVVGATDVAAGSTFSLAVVPTSQRDDTVSMSIAEHCVHHLRGA